MPTLRTGPAVGLIAQAVLLAALHSAVGLTAAAWAAGLGYGLVVCALLSRGLARGGHRGLGAANRVSLGRAVLIGGVTALAIDSFERPVPLGLLVTLTGVALSMDWVDGQVARRTNTCTPLGARFDMELDAYLLLVLSVYMAGPVGWWVLAIGGMRYAFVAGMWALPWMRATLPFRYWRKVVAAIQGIALVVAVAGVLPRSFTIVTLAFALALLCEAFGRDVVWLWRRRPVASTLVKGELVLVRQRARQPELVGGTTGLGIRTRRAMARTASR